MTKVSWKTGASGDWGDGSNWSGGVVPDTTATDVGIVAPGTYTVTIASAESFEVGSITLDSAFATLNVAGTLSLGGSLDSIFVEAGTLAVEGEITGGTIDVTSASGTVVIGNGALLSDVTYEGALLVSSGNTLNVQDGLRVETATGAVHGTITLASGAELNVLDSETLDNMTLLVSGGSGFDAEAVGGTLTFGKHFTLSVSGTGGYLASYNFQQGVAGQNIVNNGLISLAAGSSFDGLDPTIGAFTNAGTITLGSDAYWNGNGRFVGGTDGSAFTNKGLISLGSNAAFQTNTGSFSNAGTIRLGTGAVLAVETSMFTNNKSITLASEATLDVRTGIALSALGTIVNNGGLIEVDSLLNLGGSTLDVAASGEFSNLLLGGVADGTVMPDGGGTLALENGATLDAVTWVGSLAVATGSTLNLTGGVTVETAGVLRRVRST